VCAYERFNVLTSEKIKKKKETQNHEVYREISDSSLQQPDGYGLYTEEDLLCSIFLAAL
jgi:hypothetical protein